MSHDFETEVRSSIPHRQLLAAIVDSSGVAIVSKTLDGIITSWNPAAERIFGYTAAEAIGQPITMLIPHARLGEETEILARLRSGERVANFETERIRKDGRLIDVSVTSSPVLDDDGVIVGASKIVRDISESKATTRALACSEARFRGIFHNSFGFLWLLSVDGVVLEVNAAALALNDLRPSDVIGHPLWDSAGFAVPAVEQLRFRTDVSRAASGESVRYELAMRHGDGHAILDFSLRPIREGGGTVVQILCEAHDITDRKRFEQALAASQARLTGIVESAMDAIITVDDASRIVVFNEAAANMFGHMAETMRGQPLERLIPARLVPGHQEAMRRFGTSDTRRQPMGRRDHIAALRANGTEFPVEASISHVEVDGRQLFTVVMRDLTAVRQAQSDRQALEAQLRVAQKMEAIGTLAGGIAHDFNNIIGSVIGNVGLAKLELTPAHSAWANLEQIDRAATRARSLVRQILAFSRRQPQELKSQPIRPVIDEVLGLLRATVPAVVRLDAKLTEAPIHVLMDATQIHQVLVNLCTNAWHALKGSTGRIEIGLDDSTLAAAEAVRIGDLRPGHYAHIWVMDNGSGMDMATRARVFEPFFTTKPVGLGTGLGLSVVHGIVTAHQGAIAVDSAPGLGSTFHLYFPISASGDSEVDAKSPDAPASTIGAGERVVYIDDDEVMNLIVDRLLTRCGFIVECNLIAEDALAAIESRPHGCDIVVTDFNMPGFSGLDVAAALARFRPDLPVIISSGYIGDDLRDAAARLGVKALLAKEGTFEELPLLIHSILHPAHG